MKKVAIVCLCLMLASCGGKFSCRETIDGTRCETITTVYEREVMGVEVPEKDKKNNKKNKDQVKKVRDQADMSVDTEIIRRLLLDESVPIRVTPKIIRIWVAPWEDSDGDLHHPGYIYSEISDKRGRWIFGEKEVRSQTQIIAPVDEQEQEEQEQEEDKKVDKDKKENK